MTKLTNTGRTLLRSRVRQHPRKGDVLADPNGVSNLSNADLIQAAALLGLDVPTDVECTAYETNKRDGMRAADNVADVNTRAVARGMGGAGLAEIAGTPDPDADADDNAPDTDDTAPDADAAPDTAPGTGNAPGADTPADVEAKAQATVSDLQAAMGRGDFEGFRNGLFALAVKAHTPPPAAQVVYRTAVDPSKITGQIPQPQGRATAGQVGISADANADDAATAMERYDFDAAPAVDDNYVWPADALPALAALAHGGNVFLAGPAGTGKTEFAKQVAARWQRPFVRISCNGQTEAPTLVGGMGLKDGATVWRDGQLAAAIRRPGTVVLIDEPSFASAGALAVLQAVLDSDRALHVDETGEVIPVADDVLFIVADNTAGTGDETGQYEGTRIMNRALLDRFAVTVAMDYLDPTAEARLLHKRTGLDRARCRQLVSFAALTRTKADADDLSHGIGFRRLEALARALAYGTNPARAFALTVLNTAPYDDREPLRQMWTAEIN